MKLNNKAVVNGKYVFRLSWGRALTYNAVPKWSRRPKNRSKILSIYIKAQALNIATNRKHEVDHIIPLFNGLVCGLHVHENLQILSHTKNQAKSNTFVPYREIKGRKYYYFTVNGSKKQPKISKKHNRTKKNPRKLVKKRQKLVKHKRLTFKNKLVKLR